jgi:hypothetical protein
VLKFRAQSFVSAANMFSQIAHLLSRGEGLRNSHVPELGGMLGELTRECEKLDLPMTLAQLKRIKENLENGSFGNFASMNQQLQELMNRMWDELDLSVFYQIESCKSKYYEQAETKIGPEISKSFPSATLELIDASKCYAVGRSTACVFHLMRGLEVGLACMARVFSRLLEYLCQSVQCPCFLGGYRRTRPHRNRQRPPLLTTGRPPHQLSQ